MAWYLVKPRDNFTFSIIGLQMDMNSVIDKKWTSSSMRSKQSIPKLQDTFPQIKFISSFYDNYELQTNTSHIHSISTSQPSPRAPFLNRTRRARCKIGAKVGRLGTAEHFVSRRFFPPPPGCDNLLLGMIFMSQYTPHTCHCFLFVPRILSTVPLRHLTRKRLQSDFISVPRNYVTGKSKVVCDFSA